MGGTLVGRLPQIQFFEVRFENVDDANQLNDIIDQLRSDPSVDVVEPLPLTILSSEPPNDPIFKAGNQRNLEVINAQGAWDVSTGSNISIGIIDSGVKSSHEDLRGKVRSRVNWIDGSGDTEDTFGHGTMVAGIAAANTNNGVGIAGLCWSCNLIVEKCTHTCLISGQFHSCGDPSVTVPAILDAIDQGSARVLNLSYNSGNTEMEKAAVRYALKKNVVVVAAAGNDGTNSAAYPAGWSGELSGLIAVGASDNTDHRLADSNYGSFVDLYAPAENVWSTCGVVGGLMCLASGFDLFPGYVEKPDGQTSFATPLVTATAALMLSVNRNLTPGEIERLLVCSADKIGTDTDGNPMRRLNAGAALQMAAGQTTCAAGTWTQRFPAPSPPGRWLNAMTYDQVHSQAVIFGGIGSGQGASSELNDTWVWNGNTWAQKFPSSSPSPRYGAAMAYDAARGQVLLFGGTSFYWPFNGNTWVWDGTNWIQKLPLHSPGFDNSTTGTMAYDVAHKQVVFFGGVAFDNQTWVWDGTDWIRKFPATSPSPRVSTNIAYDLARSQIVLFGGSTTSGDVNDTWVWDGTNWTQKFPPVSPPTRSSYAVAYDTAQSQVVIMGGTDTGTTSSTWTWDGTTWTHQFPVTRPPERTESAMVYDANQSQVVLFGGFGITNLGAHLNDTWVWGTAP